MKASAARIERRTSALARIGGVRVQGVLAVTRLGATGEERAAHELVGGWLERLGASVRHDAANNVFGRFEPEAPPRRAAALMVGSHVDSVPEGGRYDGALGVVVAVEAMEVLRSAHVALRRPVEVVGWADEEGVRFGIGLFGSAAAFGRLPPGAARRRDRGGISIARALRALGESGDPRDARLGRRSVAAYIEPHIEQGPRLEVMGVPLAVVSSIVGILHGRVTVRGRQDHAGTTPMQERCDTLAGAAEMISAIEAAARHRAGAVGTVGEISVRPGAKNVVPGECTFSLDVRAPSDSVLRALWREVRGSLTRIARRRGLTLEVDVLNEVPVAHLDRGLRATLRRACRAAGVDVAELVSGAGHDAENAQLAGVPTGMIFIRSRGGSHSPRERAEPSDAALAATALAHAIRQIAG